MVIETLKGLVPGQTTEAAERAFEHLFASVFGKLCMPGQKLLTSENLATALAGTSAVEEDLIAARCLLTRLDALEGRMGAAETVIQKHGEIIQAVVEGLAEEGAKARRTFRSHAGSSSRHSKTNKRSTTSSSIFRDDGRYRLILTNS